MRAKAVLTLVSSKRPDPPLAGDREVEFLMPPTLGIPFVTSTGHTSVVVSGKFEGLEPGADPVWTFQTYSGSEYRLTITPVADPDFPAGGPVGHA